MRLFSMLAVAAVMIQLAGCKPPQKMSTAGESVSGSDPNGGDDLPVKWETPHGENPSAGPAVVPQLPAAPQRSDTNLLKKYADKAIAEILGASGAGDWQGDMALVDSERSLDPRTAPKVEDSAFFTLQAGAFLPQQLGKAAVADFNADGRLDVIAFADDGSPVRLVVQAEQENGVNFVRKPDAGIDATVGGNVIRPVDFDGDGRTDLMILRGDGRPSSLLQNTESDGFVDVTIDRGLLDFRSAIDAVWADFDADGALDILLVNDGAKQRCALYMAQADGHFEDRAHAWGMRGMGKGVSSAALLDIDADGWLDVILAGVGEGKESVVGCYRNLGGKSFEHIDLPKGMPGSSTLVADFDEDGREDLLCSDGKSWSWWRNVGESPNKGQAPFVDVSEVAGLEESGSSGKSTPLIFDIDSDGDLDLLDGDGKRLLVNRRGDRFIDAEKVGSPLGLGDGEITIFAVDDFDGDGDQDAFCTAGLLLGKASENSQWVRIEAGPELAGAMVTLSVRDAGWVQSKVRRRIGVNGNLNLTVGLGEAETITDVEILRPGGKVARFDGAKPLRGVIHLDAAGVSTATE